jgi:hypothetical protein
MTRFKIIHSYLCVTFIQQNQSWQEKYTYYVLLVEYIVYGKYSTYNYMYIVVTFSCKECDKFWQTNTGI